MKPRRKESTTLPFFDHVRGGVFSGEDDGKDEHMNIVIFGTEICCGKSCRRARGVGGGIEMSHLPRKYTHFFHIILIHSV